MLHELMELLHVLLLNIGNIRYKLHTKLALLVTFIDSLSEMLLDDAGRTETITTDSRTEAEKHTTLAERVDANRADNIKFLKRLGMLTAAVLVCERVFDNISVDNAIRWALSAELTCI
jgi:hypothetical protein